MVRFAHNTLDGLDDVPSDDRAMLLNVFEAGWTVAARRVRRRLVVRAPDTVRYRPCRLEERTSRSLTDPRAVTELCLAFEAVRRLAEDDLDDRSLETADILMKCVGKVIENYDNFS